MDVMWSLFIIIFLIWTFLRDKKVLISVLETINFLENENKDQLSVFSKLS